MAYDESTYGQSPFGQATTAAKTTKRTSYSAARSTAHSQGSAQQTAGDHRNQPKILATKDTPHHEALSDLGDLGETPATTTDPIHSAADSAATDSSPALPTGYAPVLKSKKRRLSLLYLPKGRMGGLNLLGEAVGWLMAWGTVGFFRAYIPPPILFLFDQLFTPWGMAGGTLFSALLLGQAFRRYQLSIESVRTMATTAIEYGEVHHRADAQSDIHTQLSEAAAQSERLGQWLVTWLTAMGCLFIIGAFY